MMRNNPKIQASQLPEISATEEVIQNRVQKNWVTKPRPSSGILEEVQIENWVFSMSPFPFVVSLGRPHISVIHQLGDIVDVLPIFNQRTDEGSSCTMRRDPLFLANLLGHFPTI